MWVDAYLATSWTLKRPLALTDEPLWLKVWRRSVWPSLRKMVTHTHTHLFYSRDNRDKHIGRRIWTQVFGINTRSIGLLILIHALRSQKSHNDDSLKGVTSWGRAGTIPEVYIFTSELSSVGLNSDPALNCQTGVSHKRWSINVCTSFLRWTLNWASHLSEWVEVHYRSHGVIIVE